MSRLVIPFDSSFLILFVFGFQELLRTSLQVVANQVTEGERIPAWWIDIRQVGLQSKSAFVRDAVIPLIVSLDPDHHCVSVKPLKLLIFDMGKVVPHTLIKFENLSVDKLQGISSVISFPCHHSQQSKEEFCREISRCISSLDEQQRLNFFHVILTMESHHVTDIQELSDILETGIQCLRYSPIAILHDFVKMLFAKCSTAGLVALPFNQLSSRSQITLKDLCDKFINHIESNLDSISTEDLLNWLRLIIYVDWPYLGCLMDHLCVNRGSKDPCNTSLKKLLVSKEFQTDLQFKIFREHPILAEWTRRQEYTESFIKFSFCTESSKRKVPTEGSPLSYSIRKRARIDNMDGKREA